jgi:hypothetical protein
MTDSIERMYRRSGFSKSAARRMSRNYHENQSEPGRLLTLPDRKSTIELGAEPLSVRRAGKVEEIPADLLMLEQMVMRALGPKKKLRDYIDLYALANAEDEAAESAPREITPYLRKKMLNLLKLFLTRYGAVRDELITSGLAEVGQDGVLRPVERYVLQVA